LRKVQKSLLALSTTKKATTASVVSLILISQSCTATHWADMGHGKNWGPKRALSKDNTDNFRNDVTCAPNNDGITHPNIFAPSLIFVVQGCVGDGHATHKDRGQFGNRC